MTKINVNKKGIGYIDIPKKIIAQTSIQDHEFVFFENLFGAMVVTPTKQYRL